MGGLSALFDMVTGRTNDLARVAVDTNQGRIYRDVIKEAIREGVIKKSSVSKSMLKGDETTIRLDRLTKKQCQEIREMLNDVSYSRRNSHGERGFLKNLFTWGAGQDTHIDLKLDKSSAAKFVTKIEEALKKDDIDPKSYKIEYSRDKRSVSIDLTGMSKQDAELVHKIAEQSGIKPAKLGLS